MREERSHCRNGILWTLDFHREGPLNFANTAANHVNLSYREGGGGGYEENLPIISPIILLKLSRKGRKAVSSGRKSRIYRILVM